MADGGTTRPSPGNIFTRRFLDLLDGQEAPALTSTALRSGPWRVRRLHDGAWGCFAEGETEAEVVVRERSLALLFAAVLPIVSGLSRLRLERKKDHWLLLDHGVPAGRLAYGEEELVAGVGLLVALHAHLPSLAYFVEAAGAPVLERVGRLVDYWFFGCGPCRCGQRPGGGEDLKPCPRENPGPRDESPPEG